MQSSEVKAKLSLSSGSDVDLPVFKGTIGPEVIDIRKLYGQTGHVHVRPRLHVDGGVQFDDHVHRRRQGRAAVSRLPDRAARDHRRLPRDLLPDPERRAAEPAAEGRLREGRDEPHDGPRADDVLLSRLPSRLASDGGARRDGRRAVGVLSRLARHQRSASSRGLGDPPDREAADAGRDGLQVHDRPAVRVSAQRPVVQRELHADDVRGAGRGIQDRTTCWCARSTAS